jgi:sulfur carrier protein
MKLTVNGQPRDAPAGATVAQVVATVTGQRSGVAAAVNGEVVPRRAWPGTTLQDGEQIEVVTAVQGG